MTSGPMATRTATASLALTLLLTTAALADGISATAPWARARIPTAHAGAAYVVLTNTGSQADTLISAASPVASTVEIHRHVHDAGVMRMEHLDSLPLAPGESVAFAPGGLHLMLIGLQQHLQEGTHFPLTLTFSMAPPLTVSVEVLGIGASGPNR